MSAATQIYDECFDRRFARLPNDVRQAIEAKIDDMGRSLREYPHYQLSGSTSFRLRVGDYRVIYEVDFQRRCIHLLTVGHRREIYR